MGIPGWGSVFGKISTWFPTKEERRRNKIEDIKREIKQIQTESVTARNANRMHVLLERLRVYEQQAKNS